MRILKFRAWDRERKRYQYPKLWDSSMPSNWENAYDMEQFTGLKDKNGKPVYEGDILKDVEGNIGVIKWEHAGFCLIRDEAHIFNDRLTSEIIGNIFETPELLK